MNPTVRRGLAILALAALAGCNPVADAPEAAAQSAPAERPNIVFIMADDHAVQALGAYGHPIAELAPTPNIDRIADDGILFRNSFVTNSLCGPSRATMLTGQFGHLNGFKQNGETFDGSQSTWPRLLKRAGYQTAVVGKWHIGRTPEGLEFDYFKIFNDQGEYYNPDFITAEGMEQVEGYSSDLVTGFALDWLENRREPGKPFLLMVHHKAPHRNWMPALRHAREFENTEFPLPETYFDDYAGRRAAAGQEMNVYRDMFEGHDLKMTTEVGSSELRHDPWPDHFARMTDEQRAEWNAAYQPRNDAMNAADLSDREMAKWKYQRYMQEYLATISAVDDSVGELLDYLEEQGLAGNTLVVYASDQGFYLGEHGWFDKRFIYEESLRTPLLMKFPGRIPAGAESGLMVQNLDWAQTMLDFAGVDGLPGAQGRSLKPVAEGGEPGDWRDSIYYQYFEYPGFHAAKRHYGVRGKRYKLVHFYYDIDSWEFYDLEEDPREMRNLIDEPDYRDEIAMMRDELSRLRDQYDAPEPMPEPGG